MIGNEELTLSSPLAAGLILDRPGVPWLFLYRFFPSHAGEDGSAVPLPVFLAWLCSGDRSKLFSDPALFLTGLLLVSPELTARPP